MTGAGAGVSTVVTSGGEYDAAPWRTQARADPEVLIVTRSAGEQEIRELLATHRSIRWVQLPSAGIDRWIDIIRSHPHLEWTSAKGAYARPVAEFAVALTLAALRRLHEFSRESSWSPQRGSTLYGKEVAVLGAGAIGREYIRLIQPFETRISAIRRSPEPIAGAYRTTGIEELSRILPSTRVLLLAASSTSATRGVMGAGMLDLLPDDAIIVNVARGDLIDHDALARRLRDGSLGAAALDATEPEPLPPGHELWREPRCLITPHTANAASISASFLDSRIEENLRRWSTGLSLVGRVDADAGY